MRKLELESTSNDTHRLRELQQQVEILIEFTKLSNEEPHQSQFSENREDRTLREKTELEKPKYKNTDTNTFRENELEQEKIILSELNIHLEEKTNLEREEFLNMISHELKTPLVAIKAYVEMLQQGKFGELDETQITKLGIVGSNTNELVQLISNILDYQKMISGKIVLEKKMNSIKKIMHESFLLLEPEFKSNGLKITSDKDDNAFVMCDAKRISQVFTNLLRNSLKAILPGKGHITTTLLNQEKDVKIMISDNGIGIPKDKMYNIFSEFYQVDMTTSRNNNGLELGLALCKQIIKKHGGKIWVESKIEHGTTVSFTLPKISRMKRSKFENSVKLCNTL